MIPKQAGSALGAWLGIRGAGVGIGLGTGLRADAESGVGIDPETQPDSAAKYDSEAGWGARSEPGSESERGIGLRTGLRADAESGVDIDPETHPDSAAMYDSGAGWGARSESGSESEVRKSDSARARNRARYGIAGGCGVGRGYRPRDSPGLGSNV